ncbi:MAG: hypothetical protein H3C34_28935 [Caldilineaceae bacterium]|nr:hypothetical protein [Caldilineaceae bacterium]
MPQPATQHPPLCQPELPWPEQILIRLDEIIGLLDGIDTSLTALSVTVTQPAFAHTPEECRAACSGEMDLLSLLMEKAEGQEP